MSGVAGIGPLLESSRQSDTARVDAVCPAGEGWTHWLRAGEILRIVDLKGNQAVDTLFFCADDPAERYSADETILRGGQIYLQAHSVLYSTSGRPMLTIVADTCGRHDTLGGACSTESNTVRYGLGTRFMHACRDTFLHQLAHSEVAQALGLSKRDLGPNVNFFMNVPVTEEGTLRFEDGISAPGKYVELRAETDLAVLISNCPQLNNPCNGYDPTPVRLLIWEADP